MSVTSRKTNTSGNLYSRLIESIEVLPNGLSAINVTPHMLTFYWEDSENKKFKVRSSGVVINATVMYDHIYNRDGVEFVRPKYLSDPETKRCLEDVHKNVPNVIIIGSGFASQAYPGIIVSITYHPNFDISKHDKRINMNKFTTFLEV